MSIYFFLIITVLLLSFIAYSNKQSNNKKILAFSFFLIFLVFILRDFSVGRDMPGYETMYKSFQYASWNHFDLYWTEWGYELLELVFSGILHFPFRIFLVLIYAFVFFSYYKFFTNYSNDYTFSLLIYICFTFMTFDMSGLRNAFALAICLFAFPLASKKGIKNFLLYCGIVIIASLIHRSAIICFVLYFVIRYKLSAITIVFYFMYPFLLFLFRDYIVSFVGYDLSENALYVGGNLLFYLANIIFSILLDALSRNEAFTRTTSEELQSMRFINSVSTSTRLLYVSAILSIFASGSVFSRLAQYAWIFVVVLLPNNVSRLKSKEKVYVKLILYTFLIWYFWRYTLVPQSLDIVPYKFFWQQ